MELISGLCIGSSLISKRRIEQLETGIDLYPDVDMPLSMSRGKTWREELADAEQDFYNNEDLYGDNFDAKDREYFDSLPEFD
jgi:hypothetical protein